MSHITRDIWNELHSHSVIEVAWGSVDQGGRQRWPGWDSFTVGHNCKTGTGLELGARLQLATTVKRGLAWSWGELVYSWPQL